jgi:hypothetical protein
MDNMSIIGPGIFWRLIPSHVFWFWISISEGMIFRTNRRRFSFIMCEGFAFCNFFDIFVFEGSIYEGIIIAIDCLSF